MMKSISMFFVVDVDIATRQEGISADGNANFHGHADLFDLNLHPFHQPDLEHCKCFSSDSILFHSTVTK
jgi:hypothetical protein